MNSRRQVARDVALRLREECGGFLDRVILYGSVARGDDGPESDVDMVVVCRDKQRVEDTAWRVAGEALIASGVPVQVLVVSVPEFEALERRGSELAHAIRDEGEVLV